MLTGYVFILSAAACWGLIGIFSTLAFSQGVGPLEVAFWRAFISWFFFAAQAMIVRRYRINTRDIPLFAGFALFGISLFYVSYQIAVKSVGAGFASVLLYTAPAWVVISSFVLYREALSVVKVSAVILVVSGVLLISMSGGDISQGMSLSWTGIGAGLTAGFCYSLYYTVGKYFSARYSSITFFLWVLPLGALGILPLIEFTEKTALAWTALVLVSFVSTFLANICYYQALKRLEAGRAAIVATLEPVIAAVTAMLFLSETYTLMGYGGGFLILVAVLATIVEKKTA